MVKSTLLTFGLFEVVQRSLQQLKLQNVVWQHLDSERAERRGLAQGNPGGNVFIEFYTVMLSKRLDQQRAGERINVLQPGKCLVQLCLGLEVCGKTGLQPLSLLRRSARPRRWQTHRCVPELRTSFR